MGKLTGKKIFVNIYVNIFFRQKIDNVTTLPLSLLYASVQEAKQYLSFMRSSMKKEQNINALLLAWNIF